MASIMGKCHNLADTINNQSFQVTFHRSATVSNSDERCRNPINVRKDVSEIIIVNLECLKQGRKMYSKLVRSLLGRFCSNPGDLESWPAGTSFS